MPVVRTAPPSNDRYGGPPRCIKTERCHEADAPSWGVRTHVTSWVSDPSLLFTRPS